MKVVDSDWAGLSKEESEQSHNDLGSEDERHFLKYRQCDTKIVKAERLESTQLRGDEKESDVLTKQITTGSSAQAG